MAKISGNKVRRLITLMLVVTGSFFLVNHFVLEPKKEAKKKELQQAEENKPESSEKEEEIIPVKVMEVIRHDYVDLLDALGTMKGGVEFKMTFQIPGTLKTINYREGDRYEKGALLMSLDEEDILLRMKRVEAQTNKTQTAVDLAKQKLSEHEKLYGMGAISKGTLDKIKLELESAEYELEAAQLEVKANEVVLEKANMYAISDGMIGELYVEVGEVVTANTLIGTHILTEFVLAEFGVIERDMSKIKKGQQATIFVDAYADQPFTGVVDAIAPVVGGASRTATVSVKIDNKDGLLLPGMFTRIRVDLFHKRDALVVPTEAIAKDESGQSAVYVLNEEDNTVKKLPIKVGYTRSDYSQIDEGIEAGQIIAVTSINRLKDGAKVDVIEKQTLELE